MEATIREARLANVMVGAESMGSESAARYAENSFLSELPGIAFGLITLAYIVGSLITLL
jgi:hypothetical protein